jgi:hypothetical protein
MTFHQNLIVQTVLVYHGQRRIPEAPVVRLQKLWPFLLAQSLHD